MRLCGVQVVTGGSLLEFHSHTLMTPRRKHTLKHTCIFKGEGTVNTNVFSNHTDLNVLKDQSNRTKTDTKRH